MLQRHFHFLLLVLSLGFLSLDAHSQDDKRPNILWIIPDDMSANFSCYGEKTITTPHVDQLAAEGTKFMKAFVTAPVCSTCRSAFITGMYQTSIGAHHHRSGQGEMKIKLPDDVAMVPALFQKAGYYTSLGGWPNRGERLGKSDYNFEWDQGIYDSNDWSNRKEGQPFFAQNPNARRETARLRSGKNRKVCSKREGENGESDETGRGDASSLLPP